MGQLIDLIDAAIFMLPVLLATGYVLKLMLSFAR
jgi:hypothetical protein